MKRHCYLLPVLAIVLGMAMLATSDTTCRASFGAIIDRSVPAGETVAIDGQVVATVRDRPVTVTLPGGDDFRLVPVPVVPVPPDPVPEPTPIPEPADTISRTVQAKAPVFFRSAVDARWDMPALPDGTPARSYLGPFFAWGFDEPGVYTVVVTPGSDYRVTVVPATPVTVLRLPPGRQNLRKTLTVPTWIIAADSSNPPIINGGFQVEAPNCYFAGLVFDGDTDVNRSAIRIGKGGSAYAHGIEFRKIGNGIHAEVPTMLGVVARRIRSGGEVKKYPFAMFAGHDFALFDFQFLGYRGIEHCIRIDANNGATPHDGIIAYGTAERGANVDSSGKKPKEPWTIRRAERLSVHDVRAKWGYAVRLFYSKNDYLTGTSKSIFIRRCIFDSVPIYANWWGSDGLMIKNNEFKNLGGDAAIHYNAGGGLRNVWEMSNRRDGTGAMHKGEAGIPGYVYQP